MAKKKVTSKVRDIRTQRGLTQQSLAEEVNVSRQTIISIEKGNYTPSVLLALCIAQALESDINDVFFLSDE